MIVLWLILACRTPVTPPAPLAAPGGDRPAASGPGTDAHAWRLRAAYAEEISDHDEAERAWSWVLRLQPDDGWSWMGRAAYLERQGQLSEASAAYETAARLLPTESAPKEALARLSAAPK